MYCILLLALAFTAATALPENWAENYNTYTGYKVIEVVPKSLDDVALLRKWMLESTELDFWQEPSRLLEPVHIMASPVQLAALSTKLRKIGMAWKIHIENIDREIASFVEKETLRRSGKQKVFDIDNFNTLEDIMGWLAEQQAACADRGLECELYSAGDSVEGREIPVFTLSSGGGGSRPVFFIDATVHAREWLTPATTLKIMDHLLQGNGNELLGNLDFVFMPMYNPDGYEYCWTDERLWRKNRQSFGDCVGVDLNRNCNWNFAAEGVSLDPCSNLYCGPEGNSEPETQAFDAQMSLFASRVNAGGAYVTFHSYGNMWMHPWGNTVDHAGETCERADDHDAMFAVADATADAIEAVYDTTWLRGTSCEVIYETTGATDDYSKGVYGISYPYNPELRGNGFIISPDEIELSFREVWAGLVAKYNAINE